MRVPPVLPGGDVMQLRYAGLSDLRSIEALLRYPKLPVAIVTMYVENVIVLADPE
ncbi:hypothetical protein [Burkholderia sp. IMCC1007]|uniref:hypothetical protein n=1 Tax=Burkholderia sp. IMCC1007 TaxID=3004104 RepID=UPI0022B4D208|nr:hypothetical protein [Burkholderia sp. IMCC1007]